MVDKPDDDLEEEERNLTPEGIAEANGRLLGTYRLFRQAADAVATAWRGRPDVLGISLIGSLAVAPFMAVPRFQPYRRERIRLWHECKDIDLGDLACEPR